MKILTVIGARPQFIKAAAVSRKIQSCGRIEEVLLHTGQHFDANMSEVFFNEMQIPKPKYFLDINNLSHGAMTGRMLEQIENVIKIENPDWVMVYGDTNSTIAGALAAKKLHVKVAHVEAGLRSNNMDMPEEINRILTDRISDVLFCSSRTAVENLEREGFNTLNSDVLFTGDVMYDALLYYRQFVRDSEGSANDFALATIHREENTNNLQILRKIVQAINYINNNIVKVIVPLHPRTQKILKDHNIKLEARVIKPVGYLDMLRLLRDCKIVLTDSGGLQKEAYFCNKPCITLRKETEWLELVENGYNILAGNEDVDDIVAAVEVMLSKDFEIVDQSIYGTGDSSKGIVEYFLKDIDS